ncbi:MAG TPA: hypothetical protein VJT67_13185, partial [Longimicrobiaceae bacterium]|nr:hypothetical protein [Longimicrobiaceae bacterium]
TDAATDTTIGLEIESISPDAAEITLAESWRGTRIPAEFFANRIFTGVEPPPPHPRRKRVTFWIGLLVAFLLPAILLIPLPRRGPGGRLASDGPNLKGGWKPQPTTGVVSGDASIPEPQTPVGGPGHGAMTAPVLPSPPPATAPPAVTVTRGGSPPVAERGTDAAQLPKGESPPARQPDPVAVASAAEGGLIVAVDAYVQAIESCDIARLRRAYPGITPAEVSRWSAQFQRMQGASDVHARKSVERDPEVSGDTATVIFTLTLQYTDAAGEQRTIPMPVRAVLTRTGAGWRLSEVLALY